MEDRTLELKRTLSLLDPDRLTADDFRTVSKQLLEYIKEIQEGNKTEWVLIKSAFQMLEHGLGESKNKASSEIRSEVLQTLSTELSSMKGDVETRLNGALGSVTNIVEKLISEQENGMNYLRDKVDSLENGKDGETPDPHQIVQEVLKLLEPKIDELQKVQGSTGSGNAGWGAHPLTIAGSGTVKSKTTRHINFKGTGVSSVVRNPDGTVDVTISGGSSGGFTELTATETPNGVTKVFTFAAASAQPSYIVSDNVWMKATTKSGTVNWTWSGGTLKATLTVAPQDEIFAIV